jgi:hypothetical protein
MEMAVKKTIPIVVRDGETTGVIMTGETTVFCALCIGKHGCYQKKGVTITAYGQHFQNYHTGKGDPDPSKTGWKVHKKTASQTAHVPGDISGDLAQLMETVVDMKVTLYELAGKELPASMKPAAKSAAELKAAKKKARKAVKVAGLEATVKKLAEKAAAALKEVDRAKAALSSDEEDEDEKSQITQLTDAVAQIQERLDSGGAPRAAKRSEDRYDLV